MSTPGKDIPLVNLSVPSIDPKKPLNKMLAPKTAFEKGYAARLNEIYKQANLTPVGAPSVPHNSDISAAPIQTQLAANPYPPIKPVQQVGGPMPIETMRQNRAIQQGTMTPPAPQMQPAPQKPMVQFNPMTKHSSYTTGFVKRAAEYGFSQKEIASIYKKAAGEDPTAAPQGAAQAPAPQAPAPDAAQGAPSIPPELLAQLVQILQQQQGGAGGPPPEAAQGAGAPDQAKIMQYLQQAGAGK